MRPGDPVDAAFAQGLYARDARDVQALAAVGHEIVWVFARQDIAAMSQLRGARIAAAAAGSSNRLAAELWSLTCESSPPK